MSRNLDAAIAEALGYEVRYAKSYWDVDCWIVVSGYSADLLKYSTDGNAMLELDAEMRKRGHVLHTFPTEEFLIRAEYESKEYIALRIKAVEDADRLASTVPIMKLMKNYGHMVSSASADTMPKAVALAAYKALSGKEWKEDDPNV